MLTTDIQTNRQINKQSKTTGQKQYTPIIRSALQGHIHFLNVYVFNFVCTTNMDSDKLLIFVKYFISSFHYVGTV